MKYVALLVAVAALCWIGVTRFTGPRHPVPVVPPASVESPRVVDPAPAVSPVPEPVTLNASRDASRPPANVVAGPQLPGGAREAPEWQVSSKFLEPTRPLGPLPPQPPISLADVLGPNNLYHDDALGFSAALPNGWTVRGAGRWGPNNSQNTVALVPDVASSARPSMYYELYPYGYPELEGPEAYFRRVAQNKENQRVAGGIADYQNVPSSFELTEVNGQPAMSYFAVYSRGNEVQTEFFVRVLGKKGYVMFFVPGRMEDVKAIMPQIKQMAATVKGP